MSEPSDVDLFETNTDASTTHDELVLAQTKLGQFLDLVPAGLFIHQEQAVLYANSEAARIFEVPICNLVGRHFLDFIPENQYNDTQLVFNKCFDDGKTIRGLEIILDNCTCPPRIIQASMSPLCWNGLPVIIIVFTDISELKAKEAMLYRLSMIDSLTETFNRRCFLDRLQAELSRFHRFGMVFSVISLDIDHFKRINDTFGHGIGDTVIRTFAASISSRVRAQDSLGRMGGEEFSLFLPGTDARGAGAVGEDIRSHTEALRIPHQNGFIRFTTSVGVTTVTESDRSTDDILNRADIALYAAKNGGRNRVVIV